MSHGLGAAGLEASSPALPGPRVPVPVYGAAGGGPELGPLRVLLVEDDSADAILVEDTLADTGLRAALQWVRSLPEARGPLSAQPMPDCVLLDLNLGESQGLAVLRQVLEWAPGAAVVVLTGLAESQAGSAALAAGAQDYLSKDQLESDRLGRAIRYAVQRRQVQQAVAALQVEQMRAQENARLERGLLPRPRVSNPRLRIVARYRPGRAHSLLGGDFYDVVETGDGLVHAVIGDVAGHGPASAALGVSLRVAWRSFVLAGTRGARVLELLEELLSGEEGGSEMFVTLTTATLFPDRPVAEVVRAGHPGFLLHGRSEVRLVEPPGGLGVGMVPGLATWREHEVPLPPGSSLVLFTDGLFEGQIDSGGRRLDLTGLLRLAQSHRTRSPDDFVDTLITDVEAASLQHGGLDDDVAVLHLGWTPA
ncbi:PP2C family protein-serine/threonine phosphatase [Actinomadura sp. WMMA1423]|uniref:PP2C family protein-serine/threonine phosphatase n=1 Tax=Actinomadura sp. WMMA1423 TaxID=2591108 RepID=UPI0011474190|nr:SpoIIE family protein phosphatase [Actinomadura sp. WMMA1423]